MDGSPVRHPLRALGLQPVSHSRHPQGSRTCVNELAERKNWTIDELADRTIPTAGFDDDLGWLSTFALEIRRITRR